MVTPTIRPIRARARLSLIGAVCALLAGCPDSHGRFNEFADTVGTLDVNVPIELLLGASGSFLLAVSTVLGPTKPLQALIDVRVTLLADGTPALELRVQALSAADRTPLGPVLTLQGTVNPDGSFEVDIPVLQLPGAANPVTGTDIAASLKLTGSLVSPGLLCGEVSGKVTAPLMVDLTGSTFGAIHIATGSTGAELPPPVTACPPPAAADAGAIAAP
jgi:hypothetical protein